MINIINSVNYANGLFSGLHEKLLTFSVLLLDISQ